MKDTAIRQPGIDPTRIYPLPDFMRVSGLGVAAMRAARRSGLRVLYSGRSAFVDGADFIAWIRSTAKDSRAEPGAASRV
jgi:hypothetical protein